MNVEHQNASIAAPSARRLAGATAIAALIAGVVLVTVVLPAEYGVDPLGTGKVLGLTSLANPGSEAPPLVPEGAVKLSPVQNGPAAFYPSAFKVDSRELVLGPYEYMEFKYHLEQGATMVFSWKASASVMHDFHGDADGAPAKTAQSYDKQPRRGADGSFVAPFAGIHGWFWENPGAEPITISLATAGFYTSAHEFHSDRTRRQREVGGVDHIAASLDQKESAQ